MNASVIIALEQLFAKYKRFWQATAFPEYTADPQWPSPCEQQTATGLKIWQAVKREPPADFNNVAAALELPLHPNINEFYGHYYSDLLPAEFNGQAITLIQAWNEEDFKQLQQNLIQHLLMQRQLKQRPSLFLATTEDDMEVISMDNQSGEVILERLGVGQQRRLANNLYDFIMGLTPRP